MIADLIANNLQQQQNSKLLSENEHLRQSNKELIEKVDSLLSQKKELETKLYNLRDLRRDDNQRNNMRLRHYEKEIGRLNRLLKTKTVTHPH